MIRSIYEGGVLGLSPLVGLCFALHPRGRIALAQRFGMKLPKNATDIWIHAASLGESKGMIPLLEFFQREFSSSSIHFSCSSPTALEVIPSFVQSKGLLPFDSKRFLAPLIDRLEPKIFLFGETELWPALLRELRLRNIPRVMLNAVVSEAAFKRYSRIRKLISPEIEKLSAIYASSELSAERLIDLGASPERVLVTGNMKYSQGNSQSRDWASPTEFFKGDRAVFTFSSVHPDEWPILFPALTKLLENFHVVVAPRHRERFAFFEKSLSEAHFSFSKRSEESLSSKSLLLLDTFGELGDCLALSKYAYLGGTLNSLGGHNPLEAMIHGVPVFMGPNTEKIYEIVHSLRVSESQLCINSAEELLKELGRLEQDPSVYNFYAENSMSIARSFTGALSQVESALHPFLKESI
jgi:3-deoxy-D-manno-octulosonic-acid transferase